MACAKCCGGTNKWNNPNFNYPYLYLEVTDEDYTIDGSETTIGAYASTADVNITLIDTLPDGHRITVKAWDFDVLNLVTIVGTGSELPYVFTVLNDAVTLEWNGTNWIIVG